jgi:Fur family ferric uptake transcriptional regulator
MKEFQQEKIYFLEHLRRAGLKKTGQRELILLVFLKTEGHLSAEDLYHLVKTQDPTVGFTTVYRTLKLFGECGLARRSGSATGAAATSIISIISITIT